MSLEHITPELRPLARPIATLREDPRNARTHSPRNLAAIGASLQRFGQQKPIVAGADGTVKAGSGTLSAARALGWSHLAVVTTDLPGADADAFAIADNRSAELAEWDDKALRDRLTEAAAAGIESPVVGFTAMELAGIVSRLKSGGAEEPELPVTPPEVVTMDGDLWTLGEHRLLCGDALDDEPRARLLADQFVDAVVTDPPFAIYGSSTGVSSSVSDDKMVRPFFERMFRAVFLSLHYLAHAYVHCDWRSYPALTEGARRSGMEPKNLLVWDKGESGLGSNYANCHELVGFFVKAIPQQMMSHSVPRQSRAILRPNILRHNRVPAREKEHNAAKPLPLTVEFIENSTDRGDLVLDLFSGSGTTLIACESTGRRCRAMEIDPRTCDGAVARWERTTGQRATREPATTRSGNA